MLAHVWFLEIVSVQTSMCVCVCVCVSAPKAINTSSVIQTPYDWLNEFYSYYMVVVVIIFNGCGLGIDTHH